MPTNINDATYFELRLVQELCKATGLEFQFQEELARYTDLVSQSHGSLAAEKVEIQEVRLRAGIDIFRTQISDLEVELKQKLFDIKWTGRQDIGSRVADVDLLFTNSVAIPISIKSGGPGTERNLGNRSLNTLLGYDSLPSTQTMMGETLGSLRARFPGAIFGNSWPTIRRAISLSTSKTEMRALAASVGKSYQQVFSSEILDSWSRATDNQKLALLKFLALQNDPRDFGLRVFVAEDHGASFKSVLDISAIHPKTLTLRRVEASEKGTLEMGVAERVQWRINVNFTNGLGLSPLALRVFSA